MAAVMWHIVLLQRPRSIITNDHAMSPTASSIVHVVTYRIKYKKRRCNLMKVSERAQSIGSFFGSPVCLLVLHQFKTNIIYGSFFDKNAF